MHLLKHYFRKVKVQSLELFKNLAPCFENVAKMLYCLSCPESRELSVIFFSHTASSWSLSQAKEFELVGFSLGRW